jgi:hypothetical protein
MWGSLTKFSYIFKVKDVNLNQGIFYVILEVNLIKIIKKVSLKISKISKINKSFENIVKDVFIIYK